MTAETKEPWGWHLLVDCAGMDDVAINDEDTIRAFVKELIVKIDMVPIGGTQTFWCETNDPNKIGWSWYQLIETSNISGHFCSVDQTGFIDIFSCKPYDQHHALELIYKYFSPTGVRNTFIERIAPQ